MKHAFMWLSTNFGKSIPTMAYQTFLFVPNSINLGRACSSDVYSALSTKAEIIFMTVYAIQYVPLIVILVPAPNSATWPLL